jgi:uncharacterized protein YcbX
MEEPGGLRLARIRVYPLKGAAGLDLDETELDAFGIPADRRWMLVKPDGGFISQRTHPRLCLIRVERNSRSGADYPGDSFTVDAPGMRPFPLTPLPAGRDWLEVKVHSDRFSSLCGDDAADRWFSEFLGEPCRLVYMPEALFRPVDVEFAPGHRVSFADGYPLHLTTQSSMKDLNGRLPSPVDPLRFRPNLVVAGAGAWDEDRWRRLQVGMVVLELVKPCARCAVTTVDPGGGTRGGEPLQTLKGFREWESKVYFGQNVVFRGQGKIRQGDPVRVLSTGERRPPLPPSPTDGGETNPE